MGTLPYFNSATRLKSPLRWACSISYAREFKLLPSASGYHRWHFFAIPSGLAKRHVRLSEIAQFFLQAAQAFFDAGSFSLRKASRSISSCTIRRSNPSNSSGMLSISVRNLAAASSIKSIALSGRNRSVM